MPKQATYEYSDLQEYKCKTCNIEKPLIFFGATNGTMNSVCKMCIARQKALKRR